LGDVEVRRYSQAAAEVAQFPLIQRLPLKTRSNVRYGVVVLESGVKMSLSGLKRSQGGDLRQNLSGQVF